MEKILEPISKTKNHCHCEPFFGEAILKQKKDCFVVPKNGTPRNDLPILSWLIIILFLISGTLIAQRSHPRLILNKSDVEVIRQNLGKYPLFDAAYNEAKERVDLALKNPIDVPVPKDAGGYTHEKHKQNYLRSQQ